MRIYNEGNVDGYVQKIVDYIPGGLEFIPMHPINVEYGWVVESSNGIVRCDYLSKQKNEANIIKGVTNGNVAYKDVKIALKVTEENTSDKTLINVAEIKATKNDYDLLDRDSTPDNFNNSEDDIDVERLQLKCFDLSLNMSILRINKETINNNEVVEVINGDLVTYLIRIYNNKAIDGYANEIAIEKINGLEFVKDNIINIANGWTVSEDGKFITTKKLSQTEIKGHLKENKDELYYKELAVTFRIVEKEIANKIVKIKAKISKTQNFLNVEDVNLQNNEDYCEIKIKNFDLSLESKIICATVEENGKTQTINSEENKLLHIYANGKKNNKTIIKISYKIKIINTGEIGGYAKGLTNYIPEGLRFYKEDNEDWEKVNDNTIITKILADKFLNPGDSIELDLILTWEDDLTVGLKKNKVEISETYNISDSQDIDLLINNIKDFSETEILLEITLGSKSIYLVITIAVLIMLGCATYFIKKKVM